MKKVLAVASEAAPLVKTGGLADVAGALPAALTAHGVDTRLLIPGYPNVVKALGAAVDVIHAYPALFGGPARILAGRAAGLELFVLDAPHLYDRIGGPYGPQGGGDWPDNWRRYAALGRAGADIGGGLVDSWQPDLVHAHDWQAAMTPAYLRFATDREVPNVITIHNLAFQGQFAASIFPELGLPASAMSVDGVEYYGGVGFLKAGLQSAWAITTVSPTYADEIRGAAFGMGLEGLLNRRSAELHGILNGIDTDAWNPETDELLPARYSARTLKNRARNRIALEERFGLELDSSPLVCIVSRLTWQKGMDILAAEFDRIIAAGVRLAILGSGDAGLESALIAAASRHAGRAGVVIGYDEALSHVLQGGSDAILVPSRFEPCGLTQLYGLRYGCIPVVARTGGLADTVIDANEAALQLGAATGIVFSPDNGDALVDAMHRLVRIHAGGGAGWVAMQKQAMRADVSWTRSAARYAELYRSLVQGPR